MATVGSKHTLLKQISSDEINSKNLLKEIQFARKLYEADKLKPFKGFFIVIYNEKVITAHTSSRLALEEGVEIAGTSNVYLLSIP